MKKDEPVQVIGPLRRLGAYRVTSNGSATSLDNFLESVRCWRKPRTERDSHKPPGEHRRKSNLPDDVELAKQYPGLAATERRKMAEDDAEWEDAMAEAERDEEARPGDDEHEPWEGAAAWHVLAAKRAELEQYDAATYIHFKHSLRGGEALERQTGKAYDYYRARHVGKKVKTWMGRYSLQYTKDFPVASLGGSVVRILASLWCFRMQRLYDSYRHAEDEDFEYSPSELADSAITDAQIQSLLAAAEAGTEDLVMEYLEEIRAITPRRLL